MGYPSVDLFCLVYNREGLTFATADSLSMIFATAFVLQRLLTFNRTLRESVIINAILWSGVAVFSMIHCRIIDLTVHSAVFGSMIFYIAHRVRALTKDVKDRRRRRELYSLAWRGSGTVILNHLLALAYANEHLRSISGFGTCSVGTRLTGLFEIKADQEADWVALGLHARVAWMVSC